MRSGSTPRPLPSLLQGTTDKGQMTSTICVAESLQRIILASFLIREHLYMVLTDKVVNEVILPISLTDEWRRLLAPRERASSLMLCVRCWHGCHICIGWEWRAYFRAAAGKRQMLWQTVVLCLVL